MDRRNFLRALGVGGLGGVAGCTDSGGGSTPSSTEMGEMTGTETMGGTETTGGTETMGEGTPTDSPTATQTPYDVSGTPIGEHPATADINAQPVRGEMTGNLIVSFEDPSCTVCRGFHETTVPQIQSNLVETGKAAYAVRTYPVVYAWGEPATHALEATFARSESAFFDLLDYYFRTQSEFTARNVLGRTETFLKRTDVDAAAVRKDAEEKAFADAVQADLDAGMKAGAGTITPTLFLFRDGAYVTKASGSVSYDLIAAALGV
ncbi:MAG: DsbA family protein [Halobaculum sp.]